MLPTLVKGLIYQGTVEMVSDVISALESGYYRYTYNQHNEDHDRDMTWYNYVDINLINIHSHYEALPATEEILNNVEVIILPDNQTQKKEITLLLSIS